jgi:hypothetical protein
MSPSVPKKRSRDHGTDATSKVKTEKFEHNKLRAAYQRLNPLMYGLSNFRGVDIGRRPRTPVANRVFSSAVERFIRAKILCHPIAKQTM